MRYPVSQKLEIVRTIEHSHLPIRRTPDKPGIPKTTFYRRYGLYRAFGENGLEDRATGLAFVVIKADDGFRDGTTAPHRLWQTDFTCFRAIAWGRFCLSTVLNGFSPPSSLGSRVRP